MTTYQPKNATLYQRRKRAVRIIIAMALSEGHMKNARDGKGLDEYLGVLELDYEIGEHAKFDTPR